jgi:hypothetical protein
MTDMLVNLYRLEEDWFSFSNQAPPEIKIRKPLGADCQGGSAGWRFFVNFGAQKDGRCKFKRIFQVIGQKFVLRGVPL